MKVRRASAFLFPQEINIYIIDLIQITLILEVSQKTPPGKRYNKAEANTANLHLSIKLQSKYDSVLPKDGNN